MFGSLAGGCDVGDNPGGNVVNVVMGTEPGDVIGIPIVGAILAYLLRTRTRSHFNDSAL